MLLYEGEWIMNSSRLITERGGPRLKNKNYGEGGKTEGKLLNESMQGETQSKVLL